jgi:hypothetical protein
VLALCGIVVAIYLIAIYGTAARNSVGTPFVPIGVAFAATAGRRMILELTRRVAGLALVIITGVFLVYTFTAHLLPGILAVQNAYTWQRFFGHVYSDAGILGPTTAVSSTYIILFIIFAAFLQASKVGDYFVNFAFAAAGRARGGPAKVAIFASGLMGMINGTSAGNVVATGLADHPADEKGRLPQENRRRGRGRRLDRRADHAADHGRGRLHHGRDHRHPLHRRSPSPRSSRRSSISCRSTSWSISKPPSSACAACARTSCRSSQHGPASICSCRSSS